MSELHDDIMRIPVPKDIEYDLLANKVEAYKIGHRDARHAAAELAAAEGIEQLKAELECARGDLKTAMEIAERKQKDADRYCYLCDKFGETKLPCALERILAGDIYVADGKPSIDWAIDQAIAQERT